jgi:hypothetical protein
MIKRAKAGGPLTQAEKELRRQILQVRLYPGEKAELRDLCRRSGEEMSDTVRGLIKTLQATVNQNRLYCIHGQLCRVGLRVNEELNIKDATGKGGPG